MAQAEQDLIQLFTGSYKSSILYGAVVDEEEPKEHSEALVEDPEAVGELFIEAPEAKKSSKKWTRLLRQLKKPSSN